MEQFQKIIQKFWNESSDDRLVLGIDGLSRSGKSTLSLQSVKYLSEQGIPYCLFHLDDLIVEKKWRYGTGLDEWQEYYFRQWEIAALAESFFKRLKEADALCLAIYEPAADKRIGKQMRLPEKGIILIEGVFLQRPEWRPYFDKVVYVDCPRKQRFERESPKTKSDVEKFINRYWKAEIYYEETVMPVMHADITLYAGNREIGETL